ncbi:MAG: glycosyltransferase, partial [Opitutales bacterium]
MMPERKPKVLLSAGMIQGGLSGVGRYVVELAGRISKMDTVSLHIAGLEADRQLFPDIADSRWVPIPESASGGLKNLIWHQFKLPKLLKEGKFDLVHIPSYRRILAFCPVRQLATIHDCAPFRLRDKYGALRGLFGRQLAPWMARRCEHVLSVSEFTKQDLVR